MSFRNIALLTAMGILYAFSTTAPVPEMAGYIVAIAGAVAMGICWGLMWHLPWQGAMLATAGAAVWTVVTVALRGTPTPVAAGIGGLGGAAFGLGLGMSIRYRRSVRHSSSA